MISTTRWSPDTCDCVLEYTWDTDSPNETRAHTAHMVHRACAAHAIVDKHTHLATVVTENKTKNLALAAIKTHLGPGEYSFFFKPDRRLVFRVPASAPAAALTTLTQELARDFPTVDLVF